MAVKIVFPSSKNEESIGKLSWLKVIVLLVSKCYSQFVTLKLQGCCHVFQDGIVTCANMLMLEFDNFDQYIWTWWPQLWLWLFTTWHVILCSHWRHFNWLCDKSFSKDTSYYWWGQLQVIVGSKNSLVPSSHSIIIWHIWDLVWWLTFLLITPVVHNWHECAVVNKSNQYSSLINAMLIVEERKVCGLEKVCFAS